EFIQRHDAINVTSSRSVGNGMNHVPYREFWGHEEHFINRFAGPIRVTQFFYGEKQHGASHVLACAQKLLPLFVRGDAENGDGSVCRHVLATRKAAGPRIHRFHPRARIIPGFLPRETGIAGTVRRGGTRRLHCVRRPRRARNANRAPTAILCAEGYRETAPHLPQCARPRACPHPARFAESAESWPRRQNAGSRARSTTRKAKVRQSFRKFAASGVPDKAKAAPRARSRRSPYSGSRSQRGIFPRRMAALLQGEIWRSGAPGRRRALARVSACIHPTAVCQRCKCPQ